MCTRFHSIGFDCDWSRETADRIAAIATTARRQLSVDGGIYRVYRAASGFELWFHFPNRRDAKGRPMPPDIDDIAHLAALTPFHSGEGRVEIQVRVAAALDEDNTLEGSYIALLPRSETGTARQRCVIEMVPFACHPRGTLPVKGLAQVVCFSHQLWAHQSIGAYLADTPRHRLLRPGSFSSVTEDQVPDVALTYRQSVVSLGLVTGVIRRSLRLVNALTGRPYYWLLLETRVGTFDVVANPEAIAGDVSTGNLAQACGSFVGRLDGVSG